MALFVLCCLCVCLCVCVYGRACRVAVLCCLCRAFLDPLLAGFALDFLLFALFGVCYPFLLFFCFRSMYFLVSLRLKSVVLWQSKCIGLGFSFVVGFQSLSWRLLLLSSLFVVLFSWKIWGRFMPWCDGFASCCEKLGGGDGRGGEEAGVCEWFLCGFVRKLDILKKNPWSCSSSRSQMHKPSMVSRACVLRPLTISPSVVGRLLI